eukprot:5283851-Pyramimonas_sp.AAC.1
MSRPKASSFSKIACDASPNRRSDAEHEATKAGKTYCPKYCVNKVANSSGDPSISANCGDVGWKSCSASSCWPSVDPPSQSALRTSGKMCSSVWLIRCLLTCLSAVRRDMVFLRSAILMEVGYSKSLPMVAILALRASASAVF